MSRGYTADGRRISSMTHARRGHQCEFCDKVSFGNGGQVAHGRSHVRRGEAVELVKHFAVYPPMSSRLFLAAGDDRIVGYLSNGYEVVR